MYQFASTLIRTLCWFNPIVPQNYITVCGCNITKYKCKSVNISPRYCVLTVGKRDSQVIQFDIFHI